MNNPNAKPKNIDEYIAQFPEEVREVLQLVRMAVRGAAPQATETISYGMPAFRGHSVLVYFAANNRHLGFYPTPGPIQVFAADLADYQTSKGAIQFPYDEPMPLALIDKIVRFRVIEDFEKAAKKKK